MATKRAAFAVLLVISVCNLSAASSDGKGRIRENEGKMAEAWDHCMKEMEEKIVAVKDFDLYIPQATDDLISTLLTEQGAYKAINTLPPQVRGGVIVCLRKNGLIFHASNPEVTSSYIRSHPSGGVLDYSLHVSKKVSGKGGKKKKKKGTMTVIIAISATSVTTFILVAVIFFCCLRKTAEPKEEKPLLHLTDYLSEGSSHKSVSLGSLSNQEPATSENDDSSSSLPTSQDEVSLLPKPPGSEVGTGLKPPPGRPAPPPPAPPPAAPPPAPKAPAPKAPPPPPARGAPPPPPPKGGVRPPPPPKSKAGPPGGRKREVSSTDADSETSQKAKLKPFFWDKVAANSDQLMVWNEIRGGSFQFSEEMIEILFGYQATANKQNEKKEKTEPSIQYIQIIDPRKAQNLAILLKALNVTTQQVVNALKEGLRLPGELLQTLQKMTLTPEEELKLRLFAGDINQLGPAERFLKTVVEIPFAFKRIDALLFMSTFPEEAATLKESLSTLEVACTKLKNSRLFMKLLEAVLKTGNRMNDGTYRGGAQAFKLDTLLKLSDVKGTDGKTTLLHFVVQEIMRYEGIRCIRSRSTSQDESLGNFKEVDLVEGNEQENEERYRSLGLEVVSGVTTELEVVRKAAAIDAEALPSAVTKLDFGLKKANEFLNTDMKGTEDEAGQFYISMSSFADAAEADIKFLSEEEKRIMELIKSTADYFHGQAGTKEGLRLFAIVRDFLTALDKVCKEIRDTRAKQLAQQAKESKKGVSKAPASQHIRQRSSSEPQQDKDSEKEGSAAPASSESQQFNDSNKEGSSAPASQGNQQELSLEHQQDKDSEKEGPLASASQENGQQMSSENQQQLSLEHQQDKDSETEGSLVPASQENQQQPSLEHQQDKDSETEGSLVPASQENQQQPSLEHQQDKDSIKEGSSAPTPQENQQQSSSELQQYEDSKEGSSAPASQENQQPPSSECQQDKDSEKEGSLEPVSQENQQQSSSEHQQDKDSEKEGSLVPASQGNEELPSLEHQQDEDSKKEGTSEPTSQGNQQQSSLELQQYKDSPKEGSSVPASQENQHQPSTEHQQDKDSENEGSLAPASQENQQQSSLEHQQDEDSEKEGSIAPASHENQEQSSLEHQQDEDSEKEGSLAPASNENQKQSSLEHQEDKDSEKEGSLAPASQENQQQEHQQDKDSVKEVSLAPASQENQQQPSLENQQDKDSEKEGSLAPASQENQQQPSLEHQQDKDPKIEGSSAPTSQENQQQSSSELQQYKDSQKEDTPAPDSQKNQQQTSSENQQPSSERQQDKDPGKEGSLAQASQENQQPSLEHQQDKDPKNEGSSAPTSQENQQQSSSERHPSLDIRRHLFPAITNQRVDDSSSDEESFSP
ncbi:hypothetical protein HRI_004306900 [Hibiscus trionum]|nr:hypothetical protein HRI_004306900 [Hibiscus trionum]